MLRSRLANPEVPEGIVRARREMFARHVSPLDGTATANAIDFVRQWAEVRRLGVDGEKQNKTVLEDVVLSDKVGG